MKISLLPCASILCLVILVGCQSSVNSVEREVVKANPNVVEDKRILADPSLSRSVRILNVVEDVVSGDIPRIQVTILNTRGNSLSVNYSFEWYNQSGIIISSTSSQWKPLRLSGKERAALTGVAPNPQAVDFLFKIKE
ncbi:MAG: DUF1425 domain-containing protein [Alphaproteobacteria bacterium]